MAKVQGVKEKLHFPLYDAFFVSPDIKNPTTGNQSRLEKR